MYRTPVILWCFNTQIAKKGGDSTMKEDKQNIVELELTDNDLEALDESMMRDVSGGMTNELCQRPVMKYGIVILYGIFPPFHKLEPSTPEELA